MPRSNSVFVDWVKCAATTENNVNVKPQRQLLTGITNPHDWLWSTQNHPLQFSGCNYPLRQHINKKKKKKRPKEGLGLKRGDSPMRKRISSYNQADTNKLSNTNVFRTFLLVCFWFFSSYMNCCRNTSKTHRVIFLHRCDLTGITRGKTLFVSNGIKLMRWLQAEGEAHSAGSRLLSTSETKFHQQTFQQRENEWDVNRANQKASDTENRHKPTSKNPQTNNSY